MLEFLKYPEPLILFVTTLIMFCIIVQSLVLIISLYKKLKGRLQILKSILEFFILCGLIAFSLMQGHLVYIRFISIFPPVGYETYRIIIMAVLISAAIISLIFTKRWETILIIIPFIVILPGMEKILGKGFPLIFIFSLIIILSGSLYRFFVGFKELKTGFSSLTVKYAIDTLNSGILLCESDGYILLLNKKMQELMLMLTGSMYRDGLEFYKFLLKNKEDLENMYENEGIFCRIPDGSTWMISKTMIQIKGREYVQIFCMNVTERWRLTKELEDQKNKLDKKSDELKTTLANLQHLSHEKEIQWARMRAHDVLGNRLSFVLRSLSHGNFSDYKTLTTMTEGLLDEMKTGTVRPTPIEELLSIKETFSAVGIEIRLYGSLPEDIYISHIFIEIIREAVTNAVRHGFATEIIIYMGTKDEEYCLNIKDNGKVLLEGITEGSGIKGMRKKIAIYNGRLKISESPNFTISIEIPRGVTECIKF